MHEIGLIQALLQQALDYAMQQGAGRIDSITVRIGEESGVEQEVVAFSFPVLAQRTLAEGAHLVIEVVPAICWCPNCAREFKPADALHECPACRARTTTMRRGREFELASLEVSHGDSNEQHARARSGWRHAQPAD